MEIEVLEIGRSVDENIETAASEMCLTTVGEKSLFESGERHPGSSVATGVVIVIDPTREIGFVGVVGHCLFVVWSVQVELRCA